MKTAVIFVISSVLLQYQTHADLTTTQSTCASQLSLNKSRIYTTCFKEGDGTIPLDEPDCVEHQNCVWKTLGMQFENGTINFMAVKSFTEILLRAAYDFHKDYMDLVDGLAEDIVNQCRKIPEVEGEMPVRLSNCIVAKIKPEMEKVPHDHVT